MNKTLTACLFAAAFAHAQENESVHTYLDNKTKAEQGDAQAAFALGSQLANGRGVAQNLPEGFYWLEEAANARITGADTSWGDLDSLADPDLDQLFGEALLGNVEAMLELADLYRRGNHAPVNIYQAQHWREAALAELRLGAGENNIKDITLLARLVRRDNPQEAPALLARALFLVHKMPANEERAGLYDEVVAQTADYLEHTLNAPLAADFYAQMREDNHKNAAARTSGIIHCQLGDYAQAKDWLGKESAPPEAYYGNQRARDYCLGRIAEVVEKDPAAARTHYENIFTHFSEKYENASLLWGYGGDAWVACGEYRLAGLADPATQEGRQWLEKAAARGHARAQFQLGEQFAQSGDKVSARYWLEQAAANGHLDALESLAALAEQDKDAERAQRYRARLTRLQQAENNPVDCPAKGIW